MNLTTLKDFILKLREARVKANQCVYDNPYVVMGKGLFDLLEREIKQYEDTSYSRNVIKVFRIKINDFTLSLYYTPNLPDSEYYVNDIGTDSVKVGASVYNPYFDTVYQKNKYYTIVKKEEAKVNIND